MGRRVREIEVDGDSMSGNICLRCRVRRFIAADADEPAVWEVGFDTGITRRRICAARTEVVWIR